VAVAGQAQNGKTRLTLDLIKFNELHNKIKAGSNRIRLLETGIDDNNIELELAPFEVFTQDAIIESDDGTSIPKLDMLFLRGKVAGDDQSFVTLHLGRHGAYGMVQSKERTWQLGTPQDRSVHSILTEITKGSEVDQASAEESVDEALSAPIRLPKRLVDEKAILAAQTKPRTLAESFDGTGTDPVLTLALECDKACRDLFQASGECLAEIPSILTEEQDESDFKELADSDFTSDQSGSCSGWVSAGYSCETTTITVSGSSSGSYTLSEYCCESCGSCGPTAAPTPAPTYAPGDGVAGCTHPAATYLASVIAGTTTIYSRDIGVSMQIQYMKVWSGTSPYDQGTASLNDFRAAYNGVTGTQDADIAHLFTGIVEGGLAYVGTACNNAGYNTGVSSIRGTWQGSTEASAYNWDLIVTAHEMGHNVGSGHTHDESSYNPTVDNCIDSSGNIVARTSAECVTGSIMSYCHLCGGTANIAMGFADRVAAQIKSSLSDGSCGLSLQ
jgi:hypothetical protein